MFIHNIILLLLALNLQASPDSPIEMLKRSELFFKKEEYEKSLQLISKLNIRKDLDSSESIKLAFKIKSVCLLKENKISEAKKTLQELYFIDPEFRFSPFETTPDILKVADEVLKDFIKKNKRLSQIAPPLDPQKNKDEKSKDTLIISKKIIIEKKAPFVSTLFPFGFNHYLQGNTTKGSIYLSLQAVSLAVNIASFWWKRSTFISHGFPVLKNPSYKGSYKTAQTIQYISISVALASFAASIIDAIITLKHSPNEKIIKEEIQM